MKKAGDLLSAIIDEKTLGKAREYSRLFSTWEHLNTKHGIPAAASHSSIQDIRHGVLIVEVDHPGWIQILQTKEQQLLSELRQSFPDLGIIGIAFKLSKMPAFSVKETVEKKAVETDMPADETDKPPKTIGYENIKNKEFVEKLKNLEKSLASRKTQSEH